MDTLEDTRVTLAEAAYVSGLSRKAIDREIDAKVINAAGEERRLRVSDLVYLIAMKDLRNHVDPTLRRNLRKAIATAFVSREPTARYFTLILPIGELRQFVDAGFDKLHKLIEANIEKRSEVLAGAPVVRGTRVPVQHVADLAKQGVSSEEIEDDLDLSAQQVEAALAYAQIHPRRGRPAYKRRKTAHVPAV